MRHFWQRWLLTIVALIATGAVFAALPEKIAAANQTATAEKFPDAEIVLLLDDELVRYDETGLAETRDAYFLKILTEKGRRELQTMPLSFNRHYARRSVNRVVVYRGDQEIELDLKKCLSEDSDNRFLKENICNPDDRILRINLPKLEVGDVVFFDISDQEIASRLPGAWQDIAVLQSTYPFLEYNYTVDAPEKLPLAAIQLRNGIPGCVTSSTEQRNGRILYRFTAKNVPQVFLESDMFGASWHALQRLHLSTVKSWEEVSVWYDQLSQKHLEKSSPELIAKAKELTAGCPDDAAKADVLFRYVAQEIRYMGLIAESEAPGYEPHDVAYTFEQRAGVCRDKAALLVAMLRIAGLQAHMVLINAGDHLDPEVPGLLFNHAIVAWEKSPGVFELMDPTVENSQDYLPVSDADSSYLVATKKGETLRTTPAPAPEKNSIRIDTTAKIDYEGEITGQVVCRPKGLFELVYRQHLQDLLNPERIQFFQTQIDRLGGGVVITKVEITPSDTNDMSQPLVIRLDFRQNDTLPESDCAEAFPVPRFGEALSFRNGLIGKVDLVKRAYPREFTTALVEENVALHLAKPLQFLTLPPPINFKSRIADWESSWSEKESTLHYNSRLTLKTLCIEPEEYDLLKRLAAELKCDRDAYPIGHLVFENISTSMFLAAYPGVDDLILSDDTKVELLSATSMRSRRTVRRKVLTAIGVRNHAEITLSYRPERESIKISAAVQLPDGKVERLTDSNINEVDDPDFAGAPRYAKGKKLVVNLPGVCPGAIIETTIERTVNDVPFLALRHNFGGFSTMVHGNFSLRCDRDLPLKLSTPTRNVDMYDRKEGNMRFIDCMAKNQPELIRQKKQPPLFFFCDNIQFSTGDPKLYARTVADELQKKVVLSDEKVSAVAKELKLNDFSSDEEKLVRIRDWVDQHIRLAGPSLNLLLPGEFFSPETTIADGYGNSSDRAILIAALCHQAGVKYEFLFASDFPGDLQTIRILSHVPALDFNTVLVKIKDSDYILNDTGMYAQLGAVRHEMRCGLTADGKYCTILPKLRCESSIRRKFNIAMYPNGSATVTVESIYYGNNYEDMKRKLFKMTPEWQRRFFDAQVLAYSPTARLVNTPQVDFEGHPGRITLTFEQPDFAVNKENFLTFELPGFQELTKAVDVGCNRTTPFWSRGEDLRIEYQIRYPDKYAPSTKADGRREFGNAGVISYLGRSSSSTGKISIAHQVLMPCAILPATEASFIEWISQKLNNPHQWRIVLKTEAK